MKSEPTNVRFVGLKKGLQGTLWQTFVLACAYMPTPEKALAGIRRLVGKAVADMQATGESVPDPLSERQYSGRFMVRVPSLVNRALATEAAELEARKQWVSAIAPLALTRQCELAGSTAPPSTRRIRLRNRMNRNCFDFPQDANDLFFGESLLHL